MTYINVNITELMEKLKAVTVMSHVLKLFYMMTNYTSSTTYKSIVLPADRVTLIKSVERSSRFKH